MKLRRFSFTLRLILALFIPRLLDAGTLDDAPFRVAVPSSEWKVEDSAAQAMGKDVFLAATLSNTNTLLKSVVIKALLKRDLFKTAYELRHKEKPEPGDPVESVKDDYARGKAASVRQRKLEDDIAMCVGISSNDIVVYSPDPDMNTKEFRALVWPKEAAKIVRLEALGEAKPESDELQRKHRSLWRLSVFVRREVLTPEVRRNIRTFCATFLEQQSPEPEILADLYWKSHRAQLSPGPNPDDRDLAVNVVIQALAKSMRSGSNSPLFPSLHEVQEEVKRRKAVGGVLPAK